MTLADFERAVAVADDIGESDQTWFPKWLRRYEGDERGQGQQCSARRMPADAELLASIIWLVFVRWARVSRSCFKETGGQLR